MLTSTKKCLIVDSDIGCITTFELTSAGCHSPDIICIVGDVIIGTNQGTTYYFGLAILDC